MFMCNWNVLNSRNLHSRSITASFMPLSINWCLHQSDYPLCILLSLLKLYQNLNSLLIFTTGKSLSALRYKINFRLCKMLMKLRVMLAKIVQRCTCTQSLNVSSSLHKMGIEWIIQGKNWVIIIRDQVWAPSRLFSFT